MINLILKLPSFILLWLSGKKQITLGKRKLLPAFQLICVQNEKLGIDLNALSPEQFRETYNLQNSQKITFKHVKTLDHEIDVEGDKINIREYTSQKIQKNSSSLVYFHGGGWVIGNIETHDNVCKYLCETLEMKIFSVDYRLSPEYKYPIPLDDCLKSYQWVLDKAGDLGVDPSKISIGGDSAGGNLAASVCLSRKSENKVLPYSQLLIYPVTDLRFVSNSIVNECSSGFLLTKEMMEWFASHYLASDDLKEDPNVSPLLHKELEGLPPALIVTAGFDPLRDEGLSYSEILRENGVRVTYKEYPSYIHGFFNMLQVPGIKSSIDEICSSFKEL